ncbi:hypothetical protein LZ31DRAFT_236461 [Colletotrichum somersetense]|nr:hypothetical protein LZ31DRAFT_236461 [Colletotrichum somersetense]
MGIERQQLLLFLKELLARNMQLLVNHWRGISLSHAQELRAPLYGRGWNNLGVNETKAEPILDGSTRAYPESEPKGYIASTRLVLLTRLSQWAKHAQIRVACHISQWLFTLFCMRGRPGLSRSLAVRRMMEGFDLRCNCNANRAVVFVVVDAVGDDRNDQAMNSFAYYVVMSWSSW